MDAAMIKALDPVAIKQPVTRFANTKDFSEPGTSVSGLLAHYHPTWGATDYDGNDCGVLVLVEGELRAVKIALDKGQLATAVSNALMFAKQALPAALLVKVTYEGMSEPGNKGYKRFSVKCAIPRNMDLAGELLS